MESNFDFLKNEWFKFYNPAVEAEKSVFTAPRTCVFYSRYTMERIVRWLYDHDSFLKKPYQATLAAMMHEQTFKDNLAPGLFHRINYIRKLGNIAVHDSGKINTTESLTSLRHLFAFISWFVKSYSDTPPGDLIFNEIILPKKGDKDKTLQELQKIQEQLAVKDNESFEKQKLLEEQTDEIEKLKKQIQEIKKRNKEIVPDIDYTEEQTRDLFIDLLLREAGWNPKGKNVAEYEVTGMPNQSGKGYVDYVLWGDDGLPLAVIEAKKTKVDPKIGQRQAELYADCLEKNKGQRPVIFYSNGYETWIWDDLRYPPREVQGFYSKDDLQLIVNRRTSLKDLTKAQVNKDIAGRYYQKESIKRVAESFSENARESLLVMATGTGKTRVSIAIVEMLMKANWVRRVLFLADRTALINQAKNAFNEHLPHASLVNITKVKEDDKSRIVFSTYPTMINCIDDIRKDKLKRFGIGHFDLIIIDEAHRSIYLKYKAIFEYFDSLLLGLTATPRSDVDKNTYQLFNLENHVPTYAYELEQAVNDKFLVPPKSIAVPMKFQQEGISYDELSEEEREEYELTFRDEETGYLPKVIDPPKLNEWVFNKDTVDKVLGHLMENGIKVEGGDKLGKTIVFAKSHKHAVFIEERFNIIFPKLKGKLLRIIDTQVKYPQSLIDDFSEKEKPPFIAVSVDMLDTGIDIPELVNLVFFKIVRSKAKFWQMIGRGTRLCEHLFAPGDNKKCFCIFDFCDNFKFFNENPDGYKASSQESLCQKIFKRRLELSRHLQSSKHQEDPALEKLYIEILDIMHQDVSKLDTNSFLIRPHRKYVDRFEERKRWNNISETDVLDLNEHLSILIDPDDDDELARRFDLLLYNLQLSILLKTPHQNTLMNTVIDIASALEKKANVPSVTAHINFIREIILEEFWKNVNLPILETVRQDLRGLIKFIDRHEKETVYTDFEDEMGKIKEEQGIFLPGIQLENYKIKVEKFIREHQNHITINKLKYNKPITSLDLKELEKILFENDETGTREDFEKAYGTDKPLSYFIRNIVGLDRNAAKESFSIFLEKGNMSANQIKFIDQIINHLTQNGVMEPGVLFEIPFSDFHDRGVAGVFNPYDATNIVNIINEINENAVAVG
jgi:type I restriction enzyme, R subunit